MKNNSNKIDLLAEKIDLMLLQQEKFRTELYRLKTELQDIKQQEDSTTEADDSLAETVNTQKTEEPIIQQTEATTPTKTVRYTTQRKNFVQQPKTENTPPTKQESTFNIEEFIGSNLINKIGILIFVLGVGIGAKYAIDNELISPLTRIILGYVAGVGLLGTAMKLKAKYHNFSAVLLSGAMAIMYFITYLGYDLYDLFPKMFAFGLMLVFTIFTVFSALHYNRQIIAHIGLVAAYAVPFLLSDGTGSVKVLFSYIAIINIGILVISFLRYWKPLQYTSFIFTWLIYAAWFFGKSTPDDFYTALVVSSVFFLLFYGSFISYKLTRKEKFDVEIVLLIMSNSFIFFGFNYATISEHKFADELLGLFTLCNAIIHFVVALLIKMHKLYDRKIFYLVTIMVLSFITIAIPVQFEGNWVTMLWSCEAALLFGIGRTQKIAVYEYVGFALLGLATYSILYYWENQYFHFDFESDSGRLTTFFNPVFLTSVILLAVYTYICREMFFTPRKTEIKNEHFVSFVNFAVPFVFTGILYTAFFLEITQYFEQWRGDTAIPYKPFEDASYDYHWFKADIREYQTIWQLNYSIVFATLLGLVINKFSANRKANYLSIMLSSLVTLLFLTAGLYSLSELRDYYLTPYHPELYNYSSTNLWIRYVCFGFVGVLFWQMSRQIKQLEVRQRLRKFFDLAMFFSILVVASSELINILDIAETRNTYKIGLSILWGTYALFTVGFGIYKQAKHLRIAAFILFGVTLAKLFLYDISHLSTIAKTVIMIALGALLLVISFLYNKYKQNIFHENDENE